MVNERRRSVEQTTLRSTIVNTIYRTTFFDSQRFLRMSLPILFINHCLPKYAIFFKSKMHFTAYDRIEVFMREIALATGVENKNIIDYLKSQIKTKIDFCENIVTDYCDSNFYYLLLAFEEKYSEVVERIIRETIIEYIESVYKVKYLKRKIKNPISDTLTYDAYIKVLSVFDKATDISALENIIMLNETLFIDSFLEFRLAPLKHHWDNLAELSSDNITLFNSSTFLDIIRFLISTMENSVYKVKVVYDGEHFSVYNVPSENANVTKIADCNSSIDLVSSVINACPNYIDIYLKGSNNCEAVDFLSNVFTNRIKIYMKN